MTPASPPPESPINQHLTSASNVTVSRFTEAVEIVGKTIAGEALAQYIVKTVHSARLAMNGGETEFQFGWDASTGFRLMQVCRS